MFNMPGEFEIIERYFSRQTLSRSDVVIGVGDDGAVLTPREGEKLVVSMDTLVEGVHFKRNTNPEWVGHKALAVNLSDMAAMGAEPAWTALALTLPHFDESWLDDFSRGFLSQADRHRVRLVGGDLTQGPCSITVHIMGFVPNGLALMRRGARPGDRIFVTGHIGDAGLAWLADEHRIDLSIDEIEICGRRLHTPEPRIDAGLALRGIASSAIDISDGLLADLTHLLSASYVGARVNIDKLPVSGVMRDRLRQADDWLLPMTSGDDYELLFCVPERNIKRLSRRFQDINYPISDIGVIEEAEFGLRCYHNGIPVELPERLGYTHFANSPI